MDIIQAIILGVVEGITEFLPISSTGHLILTSKLLNISQTDFVKTFEIVIQSGAILAVIFLYWKDLIKNRNLLKKTLAAFIPTGIIGYILYKGIKQYLIGNEVVVLVSLLLGGIALILVEMYFKKEKEETKKHDTIDALSYKNALIIGTIQAISVIPGVSRSAATIFGGMLTGLSRKSAVEFSFILAIPTMLAATTLDLSKTSFTFNNQEWMALSIGFIVSFIVALLSIKWLVSYVKKYSFIPFGIYRIVIAIFLWGLFFLH